MLQRMQPFVVLAVVLCAPAFVRGQDGPPPVEAYVYPSTDPYLRWETFGSAEDEFHAPMPEPPSVFSTSRRVKGRPAPEGVRVYGAYKDGFVFAVVVYDKPRKGETFDHYVRDFKKRFLSQWDVTFRRQVTVGLDNGEEYSLKRGDAAGSASFFVRPKHAYMALSVGPAGEDDGAIERFVTTFTTWSFPLAQMRGERPQAGGPGDSPEAVQLSSGVTAESAPPGKTQDPGEYLLNGVKAIAAPGADAAATPAGGEGPRDEGRVYGEEEVERRALVVVRPEPDYSETARLYRAEGTVKLRGVLSTSGRVEQISVIEGLSHGLTERAVQAFRNLRFLPAQNGGRRVSQWFTVEYTFALD